MENYVKHLSANRIIGDLIGREKYRFVDGKVIASVVDDVMEIVKSAAGSKVDRQTATSNQSDAIAALKAEVDRLRREINTVNSRFHNFVQLHEPVPGFCE